MMKEFTPTEAAAIVDLPVRFVQKAIDQGPLRAARSRNGRALGVDDLVFLYTIGHLDSGLIQLTAPAKRQLRKEIGESLLSGTDLVIGGCVFQLKVALRAVRARLSKLQQAKRMVVSDPEIRGGLLVVKGTRIGVYEIARCWIKEIPKRVSLKAILPSNGNNSSLRGFTRLRIRAAAVLRVIRGTPPRRAGLEVPDRRMPPHLASSSRLRRGGTKRITLVIEESRAQAMSS